MRNFTNQKQLRQLNTRIIPTTLDHNLLGGRTKLEKITDKIRTKTHLFLLEISNAANVCKGFDFRKH